MAAIASCQALNVHLNMYAQHILNAGVMDPAWSGIEPAGEHNVAWDLRDRNGTPVTAGLYFVRLEAGGLALTRRVATLESWMVHWPP